MAMNGTAAPHDRSHAPADRPSLDPALDVVDLAAALCDIPSVSGDEKIIADAVEDLLRGARHLHVERHGNVVVARTDLKREQRIILAGHLDTVPLATGRYGLNVPSRRVMDGGDEMLWGRGSVDMLGGVAVQLRAALDLAEPARDVTYVFYDNEEVSAELNGLGQLARARPDLLEADFAVLLEPTGGAVEGGCKGTLRFDVRVPGTAAHSGRPWTGDNAVHKAGQVLDVLRSHRPAVVDVDGLTYHEGLSAVGIRGGQGNNVIPDEAVVTINYRFAPDCSVEQAVQRVGGWFAPFQVTVTDSAPAARPGLDTPLARSFVEAVMGNSWENLVEAGQVAGGKRGIDPLAGVEMSVRAKEGWTDVARFFELGVPAVNFGPGDPLLAHTTDEQAPVQQYRDVLDAMVRWLS